MDWVIGIFKGIDSVVSLSSLLEKLRPFAPWTHHKTAKRLKTAVKLMQEGQSTTQNLSIERISSMLGMDSTGDFKAYLSNKKEPSFSFLDAFSDCFGVSKEWLKFNDGVPFDIVDFWFPEDKYLNKILAFKPQVIYFIREESEEGACFLVLALSDYKFVILPTLTNISSHVGGTGKYQTVMFYHLVKHLQDLAWHKNEYNLQMFGCYLPPNDFQDLLNGEVYPGKYLQPHVRMDNKSHWWEDFPNIYCDESCARKYANTYGLGFIEAQAIVRENIEKYSGEEAVLYKSE